jgi:hypothetical protein
MSGRLTRKQRLQIANAPEVVSQSIPAPIGGWNTRDALDAMDPTDAVVMNNWYSDAGGVVLRNGSVQFASGMGSGYVQTLAEFKGASVDRFIAAANGHVYNISSGSPVSLGSGFGSNIWQTTNFLNRLIMVNGTDHGQIYDGTNLANDSFTGVTTSTLVGVFQYQQRLFFWQNGSTGFWYAQLNSISGALAFYDLGAFSPRGGTLLAMTTISHDGGNGVTNLAVFIMSSGDCLLFLGNDPSLATTWNLVGIYNISPPVSPRAVCGYGADSFLTTFDDHIPLQQQLVALKLGQLPPRSKISNAVQEAVIANQAGFGWQALFYAQGRRLIFNIPNVDGSFSQHVTNTSNGSWQLFTGMNGCCWGIYKNNLYFGANGGKVYQADIGNSDSGMVINGDLQQAWNTFDNPERKHVKAVRPILQSVGSIVYTFGIGFDYGNIAVGLAPNSPVSGSPWDTSPWDTSPWSVEAQIDTRWRIGAGTGEAISFRLRISAQSYVQYLRTDFKFEVGNAL